MSYQSEREHERFRALLLHASEDDLRLLHPGVEEHARSPWSPDRPEATSGDRSGPRSETSR